jgi:hypothetical protein
LKATRRLTRTIVHCHLSRVRVNQAASRSSWQLAPNFLINREHESGSVTGFVLFFFFFFFSKFGSYATGGVPIRVYSRGVRFQVQEEILNNNTGETLTPSSSTSPVSPVVSPQKELRPSASVPTSPASPQNDNRNNFITLSPTSTSVVPAPNNISCNVPNGAANNILNARGGGDGSPNVVSPQRAPMRERRQRSAEERGGASSRRRSGRNNRNAGGGQQPQGSAPQPPPTTQTSKLDLPPGYGERMRARDAVIISRSGTRTRKCSHDYYEDNGVGGGEV